MAAHATLPMPTPTTTPLLPRNGQQAVAPDILDFLASQRRILREAPDAKTALRWQLEGALAHIAMLDATITTLQAQLWEVGQPPARHHRPSLRPQIRALLRERARPMTARQIQEMLEIDESMNRRLNEMVRDGQLTCTDGHYALVSGSGSLVPGSKPETTNQEPQTPPSPPPKSRRVRPA